MERPTFVFRILKWLLLGIAALFGLLVLVVAGIIAYDVLDRWTFPSRSPIAAHLPREYAKKETEFQRRIYKRFPVGSPVTELIGTLSAQGFKRSDYALVFSDDPPLKADGRLVLRPGPGIRLPCAHIWSVVWKADAQQRISRIEARFNAICL
jgi:hypothetical protein